FSANARSRTKRACITGGSSFLLHEPTEQRTGALVLLLAIAILAHGVEPYLAHRVDVLRVLLDDLLEVSDGVPHAPRALPDHRAVVARAFVARVVEQERIEARDQVVVLSRLAAIGFVRLDP